MSIITPSSVSSAKPKFKKPLSSEASKAPKRPSLVVYVIPFTHKELADRCVKKFGEYEPSPGAEMPSRPSPILDDAEAMAEHYSGKVANVLGDKYHVRRGDPVIFYKGRRALGIALTDNSHTAEWEPFPPETVQKVKETLETHMNPRWMKDLSHL